MGRLYKISLYALCSLPLLKRQALRPFICIGGQPGSTENYPRRKFKTTPHHFLWVIRELMNIDFISVVVAKDWNTFCHKWEMIALAYVPVLVIYEFDPDILICSIRHVIKIFIEWYPENGNFTVFIPSYHIHTQHGGCIFERNHRIIGVISRTP